MEAEGSDIGRLLEASGLSEDEILHAIDELRKEYKKEHRGISLEKIRDKYILQPKSTLFSHLKKHYASTQTKLSRASLEVLTIIAYAQPITRTEIEELRGMGCENTLKKLLEQDLIQQAGRKKTLGNPIQYKTTKYFLQCFGLDALDKLPALPKEEERKFRKI